VNSAGQKTRKNNLLSTAPTGYTDRSGCLFPPCRVNSPFCPYIPSTGCRGRSVSSRAAHTQARARTVRSLAPHHLPRRSLQCRCCRLVFLRSYVPPHPPLVLTLNCCHRRRAMSGSCGPAAGVQESGTFFFLDVRRGFLPGCHFLR
jgi:hypothetical protein